jgi:hypothetical protein
MPNSSTIAQLTYWGEIITQVHLNEQDNVTLHSSLDQLVDSWIEKRIIYPAEGNRLRKDWWDRPFRFRCVMTTDGATVRISSDGADGVAQEGEGDDLVLEVELHYEPTTLVVRLRGVKNGTPFAREFSPVPGH